MIIFMSTRKTPSSIYIVSEGPYGPCKIGVTSHQGRFQALQTGNPREIIPEISLPCIHATDLEKRMHSRLSGVHLRGEWFNITPLQAEKVLDEILAEGCGP